MPTERDCLRFRRPEGWSKKGGKGKKGKGGGKKGKGKEVEAEAGEEEPAEGEAEVAVRSLLLPPSLPPPLPSESLFPSSFNPTFEIL